jgi:uncharacterized protein (DUF2147 family)
MMHRACASLLPALLLAAAFLPLGASGQPGPVLGYWKTIDDDTNKPRSIVRIYEQGGMIRGDIARLFREPGEDPDPVCDDCDGERRNARILGMNILWDLEREGDAYEGGTILDPGNGKTYRAKIWEEDGTLRVRGYLGPFRRTQTWLRSTEAEIAGLD